MFSLFQLINDALPGLMMLALIFWLWVLIDCVTKESSEGNDKLAWTILIIFVPWIGAILYYFVRRPERVKTLGH
jgi:hypothetical protein